MPFQTDAQFNDLPDWLKSRWTPLTEKAQSIMEAPYVPYGPDRLAGIPEDILRSHQMARDQSGSYRPYFQESQRLAGEAGRGFPGAVQEYMNPYQEQVTRRISEEGMRNFREQMLPALESQFVRAGQHGSTRHQELASRAARDAQNEILGRQAQSLAAGYQQAGQLFNADMARRLEVAREHGNLGAMHQAGLAGELAMMGEQGRYQQQQEQALRDTKYQDYLRQQNYPKEQAAFASAMYHGIPTPVNTTQYSSSPNAPQTNIAGNLGQFGSSMLGAILGSRK